MQRTLPLGLGTDPFDRAPRAFETIVGKEWVMDSEYWMSMLSGCRIQHVNDRAHFIQTTS